jgi:hypothetical protein
MSRFFKAFMAGWLLAIGVSGRLAAGPIYVPNASFESPTTAYVSVAIADWQKSPQPAWYDDSSGFLWVDETGLFLNTPVGAGNHIDNLEGDQAMWLFAVPTVAVFQDNFSAIFQAGQSYQLTIGVIGGGGGMLPGDTVDISLYYRDHMSNMVTVANTTITNDPNKFPVTTHFVDFLTTLPTVKATDPWAGQNIGIQLASTVSSNNEGGYWDLDNVRLVSFLSPSIISPVWINGQFQFTLQSDPGASVEILCSTNATLPLSKWSSLGMVTNLSGALPFMDTNAITGQRFYQARQLK